VPVGLYVRVLRGMLALSVNCRSPNVHPDYELVGALV